ncbi:hypothetical protein CAPTEDRAFT_225291 [Capitella teleta]|uniref:Uncharacterized protein n=1 Tax=Capitella teleta TaxID=283909 RepID=R7U476_CAPTE|nr:hypothetical protein CAPTEDRAFT_225291 [Capitella teleta]|eukprot:ELT98481.1 hypothetical protein CAPTEDRAFT_225291 [Capitella teleta]
MSATEDNSQQTPRCSQRKKKMKERFSPPPQPKSKPRKRLLKQPRPIQSYDLTPDGRPFSCQKCLSPYIIHPARHTKRSGNKRMKPRYITVDDDRLMVCNACGLAASRANRPVEPKPPKASEEEKQNYFQESLQFTQLLLQLTGDANAERLNCPNFLSRNPCDCVRRFIIDAESGVPSLERTQTLLGLITDAKGLSSEKCYKHDPSIEKKPGRIGIGNGQKRSAQYSQFVLKTREHLRNEFSLCEKAVQRILGYSNNFLHKRLKTEQDNRRVTRVKGKAALGSLLPIAELPNEYCCQQQCTLMAWDYPVLLEQWRQRAQQSQAEARLVIAEMKIPAGLRTNCYTFVSLVTGLSSGPISKVSAKVKAAGGDREPGQHGRRAFWHNYAQAAAMEPDDDDCRERHRFNSADGSAACNESLPAVDSNSEFMNHEDLMNAQSYDPTGQTADFNATSVAESFKKSDDLHCDIVELGSVKLLQETTPGDLLSQHEQLMDTIFVEPSLDQASLDQQAELLVVNMDNGNSQLNTFGNILKGFQEVSKRNEAINNIE